MYIVKIPFKNEYERYRIIIKQTKAERDYCQQTYPIGYVMYIFQAEKKW